MEIPHDLAARQRRTEHFIRGLLEGCLPDDVPRLITSLATATEDNLLKQLLRATDDHALPALTSPSSIRAQPPRSRKRKVSLRLSRGNDKADSADSSTAAGTSRRDYRKAVQADVEHSGTSDEHESLQGADGLSTSLPAKPKASTAAMYKCIFCSTDYTTKGTCKRHLEEIHVAKRYFRCLMCSRRFATAPEARKHCQTCGGGLVGYKTEIPEEHKLYSSEFVPHEVFSTQQGYISHLLELSIAMRTARPERNEHTKLRNLLEQPVCATALRSLSKRLFKSDDGWQHVRWAHERVRKAVHELEHSTLNSEVGTDDTLQLHRVGTFLEALFNDRALSTTLMSAPPVRETAAAVPAVEILARREEDDYQHRQSDSAPKRSLSFKSLSIAAYRQPPGPPTAEDRVPLPHQQHQHQQHELMPLLTGSLDGEFDMAVIPYTAHSTRISSRDTGVHTQSADRSMMFWLPGEQQPPSYDIVSLQNPGTIGHAACDILPEYHPADEGFDNDYYSLQI
ncbi:hypothetical protein B0A54_03133 [Friedmanniomyces endolithicus]|uniref:C2H2-type domain-containing protein n=2 Tax=Dothideomycetidae TaxID=451867 RepID=A0A4U0V8C4_9PEZI|nr:hypothetical protein LTS09_009773 [Friedmanniomyces endolithicus]KAK5143299.1 hypothetical protein LTR32_004547 [Rachicladosporium monterosium]TKA44843.1 hypothetical protein B0A54_03133 [Friedmanniomyces endolithicus]